MNSRFAVMVAAMLLMISGLHVSAPSASAAYTGNLAGKPYSGNTSTSCHTTVYGRVDNRMVLFGPAHCIGNPGMVIKGPTGVRIGVVASNYASIFSSDMAFIWLDSGNYPASGRNIINTGQGNWTITSKYGSIYQRCADIFAGGLDWSGAGDTQVKVSHYITLTNPEGPHYGIVNRQQDSIDLGGGRCRINTTIPKTQGVPSGSPFISTTYPGAILGVATDTIDNPGGYGGPTLRFTNWRQPIVDLSNYWEVRGTTYGAWFCSNSACT